MARQSSIFKFQGLLDDVSFYKSGNAFKVRKKEQSKKACLQSQDGPPMSSIIHFPNYLSHSYDPLRLSVGFAMGLLCVSSVYSLCI